MRNKSRGVKLLAMINQSPWNELILRSGERIESGGNVIKHRGLILLYTSKSRMDSYGADELGGYNEDALAMKNLRNVELDPPRGVIVGAAILKNCQGERGEVEYDIKGARRFPKPVAIVNRGPVRWFSIKVNEALESQLRAVGMWREATKANRV